MMFRRLSDEQNQLYNLIDELLWCEWDPIGVNDYPDARDEYQSYTPQIFSLAIKGASREDIAQKLLQIETEMMGLVGNVKKNNELATKMVEATKTLVLTHQELYNTGISLEEELAVNQFGRDIHGVENLLRSFSQMPEVRKREYLNYLADLIWQYKPLEADIEQAIINTSLKPTYTPCVVLRTHRLKIGLNQLVKLPLNELDRVYRLMLNLFKQAYQRRLKKERS